MTKTQVKQETRTPARRAEDPFISFRNRINDVFEDFFDRSLSERDWLAPFDRIDWPGRKLTPQVDVSENKKGYTIAAELPGLEEDDLDVSIKDRVLTIKGEKREEETESEENFYRSERHYGMFQRSFRLPDDVVEDKIKAELKKGVLKIRLPKGANPDSGRKKIAIGGTKAAKTSGTSGKSKGKAAKKA